MKGLLAGTAMILCVSPAVADDLSVTSFGAWAVMAPVVPMGATMPQLLSPTARLPTHGQASYSGATAGTFGDHDGFLVPTAINGKIDLSADFGKQAIDATISNLNQNGKPLNTVNTQLPNTITRTGGAIGRNAVNSFYLGDFRSAFIQGNFNGGNAQQAAGSWAWTAGTPLVQPTANNPSLTLGGNFIANRTK